MDWQQIYDYLKTLALFKDWPPTDLTRLAKMVEVARFEANAVIFTPTHPADDAYIVYEGLVRQSVRDERGVEWWARTRKRGDAIAQQAMFRGEGHASTAVAQSACVLLHIKAADLAWVLTKHPEIRKQFQTDVAARLRSIPLLRSLKDPQIERLAISSEVKKFKSGEQICQANSPDGALWIIDRGQVEISEQAQTWLGSGKVEAVDPGPAVVANQGFRQLPQILTAGNWFVGGLVKVPHQLVVSARAKTEAQLLRIEADQLELMEDLTRNLEDFRTQLRKRLDLPAQLQNCLRTGDAFAGLSERHWQELAAIAGWEHIPADVDVVKQGDRGAKLYVLVEGQAEVRSNDEKGNELPRHQMKPAANCSFGRPSLLANERYPETVRARLSDDRRGSLIDGSDWLTLQRDDLRYVIAQDPSLWHDTALRQALVEEREDKQFDWQEKEETIEYFGRQHPIVLWLRIAALFLIGYSVAGVLWLIDSNSSALTLSVQAYTMGMLAYFVLTLPWFVVDYLNDYYVITNRRIMRRDRVIFLYEQREEAPLERVQDVTQSTTLIAKIFNYGNILIRTAGQTGDIKFTRARNPESVVEIIRSLQRQTTAGVKAEQREQQRNVLLKGLKLRLLAEPPARVLPEGTQPAIQRSPVQSFFYWLGTPWRALKNGFKKFFDKLNELWLALLPTNARNKILKERADKTKKQAEAKKYMVTYRKHPIFLLKTAIIPIVSLIVIILLTAFTEFEIHLQQAPPWVRIPMFVFIGVCLFWLWFRWENWRNDKYILSQTHITYVYALPLGLFERSTQAEWEKVQNASLEVPNFWANLFNYGTVVAETAAASGNITFLNVPYPREVQQEIFNRLEEFRQTKKAQELAGQQAALSDTLGIFHELLQETIQRSQRAAPGSPPDTQS